MRMIRRKILVACLVALSLLSCFAVLAEEMPEAENVNAVNIAAAASGGDAVVESGNLEDAEIGTENEIMPYAAGDIASGTDGTINWVIDAAGKLTVTGTGDFSGDHSDGNFAWRPYCEQITSAEVNITGMTNASQLFYGCGNMTSVDMRGFATGSVTDMSMMFNGCTSLTSLDVSGFATGNVTDMSRMFYGCTGLTGLNVSGFATGNVTDMGGMFYGCTSLTSLDVSGFDTNNVMNMASMFTACGSLTDLDISGFVLDNVASVGGMLAGCLDLETLRTPQSMGTVTIDLPNTFVDVSGTETLQLSQENCNATLTKKEPDATDNIASGTDGAIHWAIDAAGKLTVTGTGDRTGSNFAWSPYSSQITSAEINVTGMTDASYLFSGCENMASVNLTNFNTSSITNMEGMFRGCSGLASLDISGFSTENVTNMAYMFDGCCGLTGLDASSFATENVTDMSCMFLNCSSLTGLEISGFDTGSVTSMGHMFNGCSGLTGLDVSGFATGNVSNMLGMFYGCSSLTSLDITNFDTAKVLYMDEMFYGCSSLTSLDVSSFNTAYVMYMEHMFVDCSGLTSLDLSNFSFANVSNNVDTMLDGCWGLTTIQCPTNLNKVVNLPIVSGITWSLPDGTEMTELPQGVSTSVTLTRSGTPGGPGITTTTPDLNMEDVVRVKYVPYSYTVETNNIDPDNTVTFSVVEGRLAEGLQMYPATGEIYGVPTEAGEFKITVMATYSNPAYLPSYAELTLTVLDNTDSNVGVSTDLGYDITQPVTGFVVENIVGSGTQTLVSQGEYSQFRDVYIDGKKLTAGRDYTSEAGSTRITIMNQTLADGGTGTHTLGIEFRTEEGVLKRAAQNYVIGSISDDNTGNSGSNTGNQTNNSSNSNNSNNSGNSGSNSGNRGNGSASVPTAPTEDAQQDFAIYIVERNDNLWKIAVKFYGQGNSWRKIYEDNKAVIKSPNRLYAGQRLKIRLTGVTAAPQENIISVTPVVPSQGNTYVVQKGDMLWSIANRVYGDGKLWTVIYAANKDIIKNPECIRAGQVLTIPQI